MAQVQSDIHRFRPKTPPARVNLQVPVLSPSRPTDSSIPPSSFKSGHLNLNTFSPVNQNGSFEFDRVLKRGMVHRRVKKKGAWKPSWKPSYLVLRPNLLSIYKSPDETNLSASITLSDVTAVAQVKKTNTSNVFGVFSPAKNYHFQGLSAQDSKDWIDRIRIEARVDLQDELVLTPPRLPQDAGEGRVYDSTDASADEEGETLGLAETQRGSLAGQAARSRSSTVQKRSSHLNEYSGNEMITSYSDFSDAPPTSVPKSTPISVPKHSTLSPITSEQNLRPQTARNPSQMSGFEANTDPERVIRQGWLQILKSKGGVKQWKTVWVVLRPKSLSLYKNEHEYSAVKIISMSSVINAADVDPISKSKRFCLQIIVEESIYRLCAPDEEELAKWLGAIKSVLAKRQDGIKLVTEGAAALSLGKGTH